MTFVAPDPVSSGRPYQVAGSGAAAPSGLRRFIGEASFTIDKDGAESVVRGSGSADGSGVRFYEKDVDRSGKDVRTWHITEDSAGRFTATPLAVC